MRKITLFIILLDLFLNCTNPFDNRDVKPPLENSGIPIKNNPIVNHDDVLYYLQYALNNKNRDIYMICLIDSMLVANKKYIFIPDNRLSFKFIDWDLQNENNYINKIFQDYKDIELIYVDSIEYRPLSADWQDSVQTMPFQYRLIVRNNNIADIYVGKAIMKFIKNIHSEWAIYYWEDIAIADSNSWSYLKANN